MLKRNGYCDYMGSENNDLKAFAAEALVKSKDEIPTDKDIISKLRDKVIIVKESKGIEVVYKDSRPMIKVPLYLIGKFIGHKVLGMFPNDCATTEELSKSLGLSPRALSRPLGDMLGGILENTKDGYRVRSFKILEFLDSLENNQAIVSGSKVPRTKISHAKKDTVTPIEQEIKLKPNGVSEFAKHLGIPEENLRKVMFFRENDVRVIDTKFISTTETKELQLDLSLAYLTALKYAFGVDRCHASFLRTKLTLQGVASLTNLTTNLHKYPQYIIHEAGKKGSTENFFLITQPGENRIKDMIQKAK